MRAHFLAIAALSLAATSACASSRPLSLPPAASPSTEAATDRIVAERAELTLVTDSLERMRRAGDSLAVAWGGYVGDAELRGDGLRMSLRVPAPRLEEAMDRLSTLGRATRRTVRRDDVTEQTVDLDARLQTLRGVRDRLRGYASQAAAVGDLVAVERELARVQGEIDQLEARQRALGARVELAEVQVYAERPRVLGPLGWLLNAAVAGIGKLFVIR